MRCTFNFQYSSALLGAVVGIALFLGVREVDASFQRLQQFNRFFGAETTIKRTGDVTLVIHASTATPTDEQALLDIKTGTGAGTTKFSVDEDGDVISNIITAGTPSTGNESTDQAASSWTGDGFIETPWIYANAIEASDERGGASTNIQVGTATDTASDEIALVTAGLPRVFVNSNGNVGIGTTTPGGNGVAKLEVYGTSGSGTDGPNIVLKGTADTYPMFSTFMYNHDDMNLMFDTYYNGNYKSSDAGSNFRIRKAGDQLTIDKGSGIAVGNNVAWNTRMVIDASTNDITFGGGLLHVDGGTNNVGIGTTTTPEVLTVDGNITLTGTQTYVIKNVKDPSSDDEVATKGYVDAASGGSAEWTVGWAESFTNNTGERTAGTYDTGYDIPAGKEVLTFMATHSGWGYQLSGTDTVSVVQSQDLNGAWSAVLRSDLVDENTSTLWWTDWSYWRGVHWGTSTSKRTIHSNSSGNIHIQVDGTGRVFCKKDVTTDNSIWILVR